METGLLKNIYILCRLESDHENHNMISEIKKMYSSYDETVIINDIKRFVNVEDLVSFYGKNTFEHYHEFSLVDVNHGFDYRSPKMVISGFQLIIENGKIKEVKLII